MTSRIVLSIATLLAVQACASGTEPSATCSADCTKGIVPPTSSEALAYLNAAIDIMQRHSINRSSVDWPALRAAAAANANGAQTPADTYPAIVSALAPLGDRHSSLIYPDKHSSVPAGSKPLVGSTFAAKIVAAKIAWIQVPNTFSTAGALSWQDQLARSVTDMDRANPCGWMIDLRRNPGGNMWPMLVAIGPILGEGDAGSFLTPDSTRVSWFYSAGAAG